MSFMLLTLGVAVVGRSDASLVASIQMTFLIPVHLEIGQVLRLGLLDQLLYVLLKVPLIISRQSLYSRLDNIAEGNIRVVLGIGH